MIDIDRIEEAAKSHGSDADWQGADIAYQTHVTPSAVLELVGLIRLQEAALTAEQARYESLAQAFPVARESNSPDFDGIKTDVQQGGGGLAIPDGYSIHQDADGTIVVKKDGGELPQDEPRYVAMPDEFQTEILHAMYKAAQRGESVERMHFDVCKVIAQRAASVHDAGMQADIGTRLRRVAKAVGVEVEGDNAFYYGCAFSILGNIAGALERAASVPAQPLKPMGEEGNEWYFDCDGHYIDVKRDEAGKYSVYFRNQKDGSEAYSDQADIGRDAALEEQSFAWMAAQQLKGRAISDTLRKAYLEGLAAHPANVAQVGELSDEDIKVLANNYATHVGAAIYDVTKYDCEEDFFNCVRAILAAAKKGTQ